MLCAPTARLHAQTPTPVTVPTWQYDNTHSGANTQETALNLANVNVNTFGKLFALPVDSSVYAQPLYVAGLTMTDSQVHNVVFVATENDSIYAFDADSNTGSNVGPLWKITLLDTAHGAGAGATAVPWQDTRSPDVAPTIGITGTPVIDPATNTMYVVAATKENGAYFSRLHAISIITGAEQANSPVAITATVAGTGTGSSGGQLAFDPLWQNQRPALDYYDGYVYIGYAAHGDYEPWHGWLFAYDAATLAQSAVVCLSPNGFGAGIWSSGAGMPIDEDVPGGRMFVVTGNGTRTTGVDFPFSGSTGYGESVIDFHLADGKLMATDEFTAFNYPTLNTEDWDLGSGGLLMPPDQQAEYPHIVLAGGKEGRTVVLNRDDLGGYAPGGTSNTNALQDIPGQTQGYWGTPAYWNGHVYMWAVPDKNDSSGQPVIDVPKMFQLSDGAMGTAATSQSTITSAWPGSTFSISSNDEANGIAWAVRSDQFNTNGPAVLYAWNANDLTDLLYESDTNSKRDAAGPANRFAIPVVTNGKVYVATHGQVDVYGLFNDEPNAAAPVITPDGGTFSASQSVKLSTTTASADIYYTLDGALPTPSSTLYTGSIAIGVTTTLKAIATASGYVQSGVSSATFSFSGPPPVPSISPAGGTYTSSQNVRLSDTDSNAKIYYTTDGSTPSASSNLYSDPIPVAVSETIEAIAIDPAQGNSPVNSAAYIIQSAVMGSFALTATPTQPIAQGGAASSTVTITPSGGYTGSVAIACTVSSSASDAGDVPTCSATQPAPISGTGAVTSTVTVNTLAGTSPGVYTATVTGSDGSLVETTTIALTVASPAPTPAVSVNATPAPPVMQGGSTSSTVTITPSGGFTGSVSVVCAVTSSPVGANDVPTCSATQPAAITDTSPVTSTLTIHTTAPASAALHSDLQRIFAFSDGGMFAALLLFWLPVRRRRWPTLFSILLFLGISVAAIGCGATHGSTGPTNLGTTAGSYTVTVTATSGSTNAAAIVTFTVD